LSLRGLNHEIDASVVELCANACREAVVLDTLDGDILLSGHVGMVNRIRFGFLISRWPNAIL